MTTIDNCTQYYLNNLNEYKCRRCERDYVLNEIEECMSEEECSSFFIHRVKMVD